MNQRAKKFSIIVLLTIALLMLAYQQTPIVHASLLPTIGIWSEAYASPNIVDPSIIPGTTITVDINVTNAPAFNGYDLIMYWDPTYLQIQFVNVRGGVFTNPFVGAEDISAGQIRLAVVNIGNPYTGGSGVLAQIQFNATGRGVSPLTLAAATTQPSRQSQSSTQLVYGYAEISTTTEDGYFSNLPGNPGPIANFTFAPQAPLSGDTITFNASESVDPDNSGAANRGIASYNWDFGDGFFENSSTPVITYTYEFGGYPYTPFWGNFSARLTVVDTDNRFEGMITKNVEVSIICPPGRVSIEVPRDCPTIQNAIDSVVAGGTIRVSPGTYIEKPWIQKPLTLVGSGNPTTLEGLIQVQAPNVTVSGFRIVSDPFDLGTGVSLLHAPHATITNNLIVGQEDSLGLENQEFLGITVSNSSTAIIENNTVEKERYGISLHFSPHGMVQNNTLTDNAYNLDVSGSYTQDIGESNLLNGRPAFYGTAVNSSQIPRNPGYVGIVNSHDLRIGPLSITNVGQGILAFNSTRITIDGLNATNVLTAGMIMDSTSFTLEDSTIARSSVPFDLCSGLELDNVRETTLKNNTIDCRTGISLHGSSASTIANNSISTGYSSPGIYVQDSFSNQFSDNRILSLDPFTGGFDLSNSTNNLLINNWIDGGISLDNSPRNTLIGNNMNSTYQTFAIFSNHKCINNTADSCRQLSDYIQDIDPTNSVNGRPVYFLVNRTGISVPSDAGFVAVVNSTNILVQNLSPSPNPQGVLVISSRNVRVLDNNIVATSLGVSSWRDSELTIEKNSLSVSRLQLYGGFSSAIEIQDSGLGTIRGNLIQNSISNYGIFLRNSTEFSIDGNLIGIPGSGPSFGWLPDIGIELEGSSNDTVSRNTPMGAHSFAQGTIGIQLVAQSGVSSSDNLIEGNTLANHFIGLDAGQGSGNIIYDNDFLNNYVQAQGGARDTWNNPAGQGNYWSGYPGQDTDNDGVGDTLLPFLGLDNYPLMSPWSPTGLAAKLTGRASWPEVRRLSISESGGSTQTFHALANDTGTAAEWVQVVFNVTSSNGSTSRLVSRPIWMDPGTQTVFTVQHPVGLGPYRVVVTVIYSSDAYQEWNTGNSKSFSFQAVP